MKAEIITIGDEILIGQITDTNSGWISRELGLLGLPVTQITSIGDKAEQISHTVTEALKRSDLVLMTGGLGPTKDDITKATLAKVFDSEMYFDEEAYANVEAIFKRSNRPMLETNRQQAMLPDKCRPLYNPSGTAPGMLFEKDGHYLVSMPGVPTEMKAIMSKHVLPFVKEHFTLPEIIHKTYLTAGIGESFLAEKIRTLEDSLPSYIKLAYLPHLFSVRLRFSGTHEDKTVLDNELSRIDAELKSLAREHIVAEEDIRIEEAVGKLLLDRKLTVGTVESCTGGYVSHLLTSVPGSSAYYLGSMILYSYELKMKLANVKEETLNTLGAVSAKTVEEMATGAREKLGVDYCIATSGIAGPGGATAEKPVGTVWMAIAGPEGVISFLGNFRGNRLQIIERTAMQTLDALRKLILKK